MQLRRAAAWISTAMVAIVVALAVPVAQLRVISVVKSCCCPDPNNCHCPDHKGDPLSQPQMRPCHSTERVFVAPELPTFRPVAVAIAPAPVMAIIAVDHAIPAPHPAPPPDRPDAPS